MKITHEKLKVLNALKVGPQTHKVLRMAYYGPERYLNPSNTSFYNQLGRMMEDELIRKTATGIYELAELGRVSVGMTWDCDFCGAVGNKDLTCVGCGENVNAYNLCIKAE